MNRTIKQFAIETKICSASALEDPEGYDGYAYYDNLTHFVEQTKQYYMNRAARECLEICEKLDQTQGTAGGVAAAIKQHFGVAD